MPLIVDNEKRKYIVLCYILSFFSAAAAGSIANPDWIAMYNELFPPVSQDLDARLVNFANPILAKFSFKSIFP